MNYVDEDIYFEASNFANEFVKEISKYIGLPVYRVKCMHVKQYMEEVEEVDFLEVEFEEHLNGIVIGSIAKIFGEVLITINKNTIYPRKWFTTMHEVGHYFFDLITLKDGMSLSDMVTDEGYLPEDLPREYRANVIASVLMANDEALIYAINKFKCYHSVCNYFYMSKAALQNRLVEYLVYIKNCAPRYAFSLVNNYRYCDGVQFKKIFFNQQDTVQIIE
nr:ImmA/IrrE family metallo-endopeptidase [Enterococcus innesii]